MKTLLRQLQLLSVLIFGFANSALSQGSLTPPGAPASTMKTLDQVEARTPISGTTAFNGPGSYYLTQNVTASVGTAFVISSSNVTFDLNGYTISSTQSPAGTGNAILINAGYSNITILNGNINSGVGYSGGTYSGTGFGNGINCAGLSNNVRVRDITVSGVLSHGIYLGFGGSIVEGCAVTTAGGYGIYADSVSNSTAMNIGSVAILANNALNCRGRSNANNGLSVTTATNCYGTSAAPSGHGVSANAAQNCIGSASGSGNGVDADIATGCEGNNTGTGIGLNADVVDHCRGSAVSGAGIQSNEASGSQGVSGSGDGIVAVNANTCRGVSSSGVGISARSASTRGTTTNCYGETGNNIAIDAQIAIGCFGKNNSSGNSAINCDTCTYCTGFNTASSGSAISAAIGTSCDGLGGPLNIIHNYFGSTGPAKFP